MSYVGSDVEGSTLSQWDFVRDSAHGAGLTTIIDVAVDMISKSLYQSAEGENRVEETSLSRNMKIFKLRDLSAKCMGFHLAEIKSDQYVYAFFTACEILGLDKETVQVLRIVQTVLKDTNYMYHTYADLKRACSNIYMSILEDTPMI